MKKNKGITLVALVITIIVLLILAAVSISLALGQNGVLTRASDAIDSTERAKVIEEITLSVHEAQTAYYTEMAGNVKYRKNVPYYEIKDSDGNVTYGTTFPDVFKNNCSSAADIILTSEPVSEGEDGVYLNASNEGTVTGVYQASNSKMYYPFSIDVDTGELIVDKSVENVDDILTFSVPTGLTQNEKNGLPNGVSEINKPDSTNPYIKSDTNIRAVIQGEVPIPKGFYYVGGTIEDGIVISDNELDSGKGTSYAAAKTLVGNQFVWVPVPAENEFRTYIGLESEEEFATCSEPCTYGYSSERSQYNAMKTSVAKFHGFFIARYESSNNNGVPESKQGKEVWNCIPWGEAQNDIGREGAVYKSSVMYTNRSKYGVISTLPYGCMWDAIMIWIDSGYMTDANACTSIVAVGSSDRGWVAKGFYTGPTTTGSNENYAIKNTYDLLGNVSEWTMEGQWNDQHSNGRNLRGGNFRSSADSGVGQKYQNVCSWFDDGDEAGFRVALIVN